MNGDSHAEVLHRLREVEESIDCVRYDHSRLTVENFYLQERIRKAENPIGFKDRVLQDPFKPNDWELCPPYKRVDVCELNNISNNYAQHVLARLKILENNAEHMRHQVALMQQSNTDLRVRISLLEGGNSTASKSKNPTNQGYLPWLQANVEQTSSAIAKEETRVAMERWETHQKITIAAETDRRLKQLEEAFNSLFPPVSASQLEEGLPEKPIAEPCQHGTLDFRVGQLEQAFLSLFPPVGGTQEEKVVSHNKHPVTHSHETPAVHLNLEHRSSCLEHQILESGSGRQAPNVFMAEKLFETRLKATLDQNLSSLVRKDDLTITMRTIDKKIHKLVVHPNLKVRIEQLESIFLATMMDDPQKPLAREDTTMEKKKSPTPKTNRKDLPGEDRFQVTAQGEFSECKDDVEGRITGNPNEEEARTQDGEKVKNTLSQVRIALFSRSSPHPGKVYRNKRKVSICDTVNRERIPVSKSSKITSNCRQNTKKEPPEPPGVAAPRAVNNPYVKK